MSVHLSDCVAVCLGGIGSLLTCSDIILYLCFSGSISVCVSTLKVCVCCFHTYKDQLYLQGRKDEVSFPELRTVTDGPHLKVSRLKGRPTH